jgi:CTP:molybdopterin cytidylyltransferase MocA
VRNAHNEAYDRGMFSSVMVGIRQLPVQCEALFVLPVDIAFVQSATIGRLIEAFRNYPGRICHPCVANRRGHPPPDSGLLGKSNRRALKRWAELAVDVPVTDRHIILALDAPEDLLKLSR